MLRKSIFFRLCDFRWNFIVLTILCFVFFKIDICFADTTASSEKELLSLDGAIIIGHIDFPPVIYSNEDGESIGHLADMIRLVLDRSKFYPKYKLTTLPTKRVIEYLINGKIPFSPLIRGIPKLKDKIIYSDSKISTLKINAYFIGETGLIKTLNDLKGKRIIGLRGYSYGGRILNFIKDPSNKIMYHLCSTHESGFRMLQLGRGDCFIEFQCPAVVILNRLNIENLRHASLENIDLFFNISKKAPDYLELKESLDKAYKELLEEGRFDQLLPTREICR